MERDAAGITNELIRQARYQRGAVDGLAVVGFGAYVLVGPDGRIKQFDTFQNLITDVGDDYYARRASGVAGSPGQVTGMRLGTGATAAAKNGAGAAIVTYTTGSDVAIDGGFPTGASKGAGLGYRITWQTTWNAGVATANGIQEVVITNESPLTDVAGTAANTISRAKMTSVVNKEAGDVLTIVWQHDILGA